MLTMIVKTVQNILLEILIWSICFFHDLVTSWPQASLMPSLKKFMTSDLLDGMMWSGDTFMNFLISAACRLSIICNISHDSISSI